MTKEEIREFLREELKENMDIYVNVGNCVESDGFTLNVSIDYYGETISETDDYFDI